MCRYETTISVYVPHMSLLQSTMGPGALIYIISHYWHMPLNKNTCHIACICTTALIISLHVGPTVLHTQEKTATFIYYAITIYVPTTNMPLKCHMYATYATSCVISDNYISKYTSYEWSTINNVARNTGIHTFHIIDICSLTNIPATLHI